LLRRELEASDWSVVNKTPLPVVCFVDGKHAEGKAVSFIEAVAREVVSSGKAWISTTRIGGGTLALRACITNHRTGPDDVYALVQTLNWARQFVVTTSVVKTL
jgi:hypothetical protein